MQLSTLRYQGYTARITNLSTMEELQDWVSECNITLPQSNLISSMEARFQLEEKKINKGNEVKIEILDDVGNTLYTLQGEANIPRRTKSYTGLEVWEYTVKDSYNRLFEKVVPESQTYYDLYLCNTNDKHNSLLHKIASALGFREEELDFESVAFENGNLIRLPFVYLEENSRWIDKLQAFIEATDGILYVKNKKLFYRPRNLAINNHFSFNVTNIMTSLEESEKEVLQNGIKLVYDRFEKLENQVVFNLKKKIITEPNTGLDTEVPTMRISFITSAVSNPTLTKATGYYFKTDDPSSKVDITLEENVHYKKVSWKETGAEVKFYNPLPHKLYVDNFEIKGVPLSMYADNEVSVMFPSVLEKRQENFITASKNKFIQTSEQAKFLAKKAMRRGVVNHAEYQFKTPFLHQIEVGGVYGLDLEDIHTVIEITNLSINLRPGVFRMDIQGISVKEELGNVKITSKLSGNPKESYVDLSSVKEDIQSTKSELVEKYDKKLLSLTEKYDEQLVNISDIHKEELSKITEKLGQLSQGIQDNKVKIYTLKPSYDTLTDLNIGDMYVSDTTVEILIKEGNRYVWKAMKDTETKQTLESYMQDTNSKLVTISYQFSAPESPNVGDIWIDTQNDGIWKRWNGSEWEQVDKNVRDTLKKANQDIQKIESSLETVNNTVNRKILAKAFVQEQEPKSGMKEYDVWYKPSTNTYKVYLNWRWNNASEDDIFPALRHYASLENAKLEIGKKIDKTNERAGLFLTNNDQTFGSKYGELAEVSLDKQGAIRLKNANNLLEWNVKDPWSTTKMKSKFYMGVTDVDKVPDNVYFKIGDETNGFSIELKEGERAKAKLDGKELSQKFGEVNDKVQQSKEELDRNINNLAEANAENKRTLESKIEQAKEEASRTAQASKEAAQRYADALTEAEQIRADKNATEEAKKQAEEKLQLAKTYAEQQAEKSKIAAQKYADGKLQQFTQSIQTDIESIKSQLDGVIETWFYDDEPTLYNKPASDWTTTSEKEKHVGDLYYSKNGKSYRFMKDGNGYYSTYKWTEIADTDVAKALEEARKAKDTADKKRRVFVETPRPPYDEGDLWVKNDKVQVCRQTKEKGQFSVYDWRALSYTDDTKANEVEGKVNQNKEELDRNINNLAQADSENKRDLEEKLNTAKQEINAQLVNADGKWTALQGQYQETVKDITSFKTQTSKSIDTVQGALQQGNFTVTGNTSFDGAARFVSKGTNEVITIADGAIDFHRDGKRLTRIKNIRHGTISTDSKGKGVVTFDGFIQPMFVMASIKSANFGKNMASVFCYASNIKESTYQFFLGGSNEEYIHGNAVTKIGDTYAVNNCVITTLTHVRINLNVYDTGTIYAKGDAHYMIQRPSIRVVVTREDEGSTVLLDKVVEIRSVFDGELRQDFGHTQWRSESHIEFPLQNQRVYQKRTDIKYKVKVTKVNSKGEYGYFSKYNHYFVIPKKHEWVNTIAITAMSDTSEIGNVQGEGEVSYIALEID